MLRPVLAVLFALGAGAAHAGQVRIFAVGHKTRMADVTTYQTYRDKMGALMDAAFPGRASLVHAGVDDVRATSTPPIRSLRRRPSWSSRRRRAFRRP
jgi:hypothetical protein